jgi:hypothetical protein
MAAENLDRTGVLVIRIWVERASPLELRARVTHTTDVARRVGESSVASTTAEISDMVQTWLGSFVDAVEGHD